MLRTVKLAAVLALLAVCVPAFLSAQAYIMVRGYVEVEPGEFTIDLQPSAAAYAGTYHFGDSEEESDLELSVSGNRVTGRLTWGELVDDRAWVESEARLEGGRIEGAMLIAPGWSGVFVRWNGNDGEEGGRGLIIFRAPQDRLKTEFGYREDDAM